MIIYHAPTAEPGSRWQPTQADAKALKVPFVERRVAEDGRSGMCDLLNVNEEEVARPGGAQQIVAEPVEFEPDADGIQIAPSLLAPRPAFTAPDYSRSYTCTEIEDYILNRAPVHEVENILSCLGCRFGELAKAARS